MRLIGAGLPRTATLTQKVALEMLGYGPCYHMVNVLGDLDLVPTWRRALDGDADWPRIFEGFQSSVDYPGSYFYKEQLEVWPDAKVLLSVRSPEAWERSMLTTIVEVLEADSLTCHLSKAAGHINPKWAAYGEMMNEYWRRFGIFDGDRTWSGLQEAFNRHNEEVKRHVPAGQLLVWEPADGWEPVCEFLEVEVPDQPLPRTNDAQVFAARVNEMSIATINEWWQRQQSGADAQAAAAQSH